MPSQYLKKNKRPSASDSIEEEGSGFKFHMVMGDQVYAKRRYRKASPIEKTSTTFSCPTDKNQTAGIHCTSTKPTGVTKKRRESRQTCSRRSSAAEVATSVVRLRISQCNSSIQMLDNEENTPTAMQEVTFEPSVLSCERQSVSIQTAEHSSSLFLPIPQLPSIPSLPIADSSFGGLLARLKKTEAAPAEDYSPSHVPLLSQQGTPIVLYHSESLEEMEKAVKSLTTMLLSVPHQPNYVYGKIDTNFLNGFDHTIN